jgi:cytochrome c
MSLLRPITSLAAAVAGAAALLASGNALANVDGAAALKLAQANACMACHAVDRKMVGPSYKDIAAKYKGMEVDKLAASIKAGGAGKWGPVPMPAQANLKPEDAKTLAAWVLAGAPSK